MIEDTVTTYLKSDATLDTLLGSSSGNSKFYPNIPKEEPTAPYVLYDASAGDESDEHVHEDRIQYTICSPLKSAVEAIAHRIRVLLDVKDFIQDNLYSTNTNYYIYYSSYSGGSAPFEPVREQWQIVLFFNVRYQYKSASR